jgi:protein-disulfide isomerase
MTQFLGVAALLLGAVAAQAQSKAPAKPAPAKAAPAKPAAKAPAAAGALDKTKLEAYVRHLLLWGPQITVTVADAVPAPLPGFQEFKVTGSFQQVSLDEIFYVSADGHKIVRGSVYDIGQSPFTSELSKLKTDLQPSMGTPGAPVVLVLFSDFQCAYCREEAKQIRQNLLKTYPTQVRLYFKDFPLDQIHPWARNASVAGRCVFRQNPAAFWDFHDWIFEKQSEITGENLKTKITEWAQSKGLDNIQFARCYDTRATEAEVNKNITEGKALRISSTPTMFVNGRPLPGSLPWAQLKSIIDWELDYSKKTGESGEQCCTLTLPVPGKK